MRKILLASGDSWTDPNFHSEYHPEMDCDWPKWPELLAEKLDMDYINLGECGAGNKYIYASILDKMQVIDPNDIGLVIVGWSQAIRNDIKIRNVWKHLTQPLATPYSKSIRNYGDITHRVEESLRLFYSLQEICKSKNIPLAQIQMIPLFRGYNWIISSGTRDKIDETNDNTLMQAIYDSVYIDTIDNNFIGWPTENSIGGFSVEIDVLKCHIDSPGMRDMPQNLKYIISKLDSHPNAAGQVKIAEYLYDKI